MENNAISATAVLEGDLHCMKCRYNLRTLSLAGNCSECGTSIAESMAYRAPLSRPNVRRVFWGAVLVSLAAGVEIGGSVISIYFLDYSLSDNSALLTRCAAIGAIGVLKGILIFAAVDLLTFGARFRTRRVLPRVICLGYAAMPIGSAMIGAMVQVMIAVIVRTQGASPYPVAVTEVIHWTWAMYTANTLWLAAVYIIAWRFLVALADRLGSRPLRIVTLVWWVLIAVGICRAVSWMNREGGEIFGSRFMPPSWEIGLDSLVSHFQWPEAGVQLLFWAIAAGTVWRAGRRGVRPIST